MNARTRRDDVRTTTRTTSWLSTLAAMSAAILVLTLAPAAAARLRPGRSGGGQFHLTCMYTQSRTDDPIVFPNKPGASHLHQFFGNVSTSATSTFTTMQRSGTSCRFAGDRSAYWAPALISTTGQEVKPISLTAYYYAGNGRVVAFPPNFRLIAGAVSGSHTTDLSKFGYTCGGGTPTSTTPPNCGSLQVKAVVVFPSCWNGKYIDSLDHRSHMAYPRGNGCPSGYPVLLPKIVLHIRYPVTNATGYRLSSDVGMGYTSGMSMHADFWNVWDPTALNSAVTNCLNAGKDCDLG